MTEPTTGRRSEHPVDPLFLERWSPRGFTGEPIPKTELLTILEAGRWAPSAYNAQPWRFIYALPGGPGWDELFSTLVEFNQKWASRASALVLLVAAEQSAPHGGQLQPNPAHSHDAGAAWASVALQAYLAGWAAHGMTGFDKEAARSRLNIPEGYALQQVFAIGRTDPDAANLPEELRALEKPSQRKAFNEIVAEGRFTFHG